MALLDFDVDGASVQPSTACPADIDILQQEFDRLQFRAGARPFELTAVVRKMLAADGCLGRIAFALSHSGVRPVRVLAFDKTPQSNWSLGWHQDRVIAVKARVAVTGYQNWTLKGGVPHVEAPAEILARMFSLRLHLDDCDRSNGALKVLPRSAERGKLADAEVRQLANEVAEEFCEAKRGEVVAMKALTVHASEPSIAPKHRRVLHVDYAAVPLPHPLQWALEL